MENLFLLIFGPLGERIIAIFIFGALLSYYTIRIYLCCNLKRRVFLIVVLF